MHTNRYFAIALLICVAGCTPSAQPVSPPKPSPSNQSSDNRSTEKKGVIGYSALTLKNPFFKIIADSLAEDAAKYGYTVELQDAQRDVSTQAKHIDNYIAQKVTAIVINPVDRIAIGPAIKKANDAGIPVFTNDLQCVAEGVEIAGHIGTDNLQGGRLAGEAMIEALGEDGGEVLVLHFKQANSCVLRVDGFREVIEQYNEGRESGKIEIVKELDGGGLRDEGFRAATDGLQAHQNLAGIFAINDPSAIGAWNALELVKRQDQVVVIGFDAELDGKRAIKEGKIYADPIQFPKKMGVVTMQNILKNLDGEDYDKMELIPTELYKKADADADPDLN